MNTQVFNLGLFISKKITQRKRSLLLHDFVRYSTELKKQIENKKVMVIGGAGTIGSHYIKALLKFKVASLVVVDINENGLTELVRDLRSSQGYIIPERFITYPINFGDRVFEKLFKEHGPFQIVANFAAHKHVRSEKDIFSIEAMVENNVLKTRKLLDLLLECPPEHFFCVSTDKAANPVNIMGASKKLMEELIMVYADQIPITTARFANVAFSNGSLPFGFMERLAKNQPWSCPLAIRRFFVSPVESGELCLAASVLGESGDIFYPKLDKEKDMIPFDQIARDLLDVIGMDIDVCETEDEAKIKAEKIRWKLEASEQKAVQKSEDRIAWPVYFFGSDTSGEKSFEEFYTDEEIRDENRFNALGVIKSSRKRHKDEIDEIFRQMEHLFNSDSISKSAIVEILKSYLPNFEHIETGKSLDSKM